MIDLQAIKFQYIGQKVEDVVARLSDTKWRYLSIDGEGCVCTADFRPDRLNFDVVDGKIVDITLG